MKRNPIVLSLFFLICISSLAQKKEYLFVGKINDSLGIVKNATVIDLQTKKGTFSNDFGEYRIYASLGDSIQVSSVQHKNVKHIVSEFDLRDKIIDIYLERQNILLDPIIVKTNELDGYLILDRNKIPKNKRLDALQKNLDLTKVDVNAGTNDDYINTKVRPQIVRTNPNAAFGGAGVGVYIPFKNSEKLWRLRRNIAYKEKFPELLLSDLGEKFFFEDLEIPRDLYYHFLEYCSSLKIEELYMQDKEIEVVKILRQESVTYKKVLEETIKEEKKN